MPAKSVFPDPSPSEAGFQNESNDKEDTKKRGAGCPAPLKSGGTTLQLEVRTHAETEEARVDKERIGIEARRRARQILARDAVLVEHVLDIALDVPGIFWRGERELKIGVLPGLNLVGRCIEDAAPHISLPIEVGTRRERITAIEVELVLHADADVPRRRVLEFIAAEGDMHAV